MTEGTDRTQADGAGQGPARPTGGMGGWSRLILIASLVLNLVLIGAIVGAGLGRHTDAERRPVGEPGLALLFESLAPQDQRAFRRDVLLDRERRITMRREIVADVRTLLAALRAEPFDRGAVAGALDRQVVRAASLLDYGAEMILDRIEAMTPAERRAYADTLEGKIRRRLPAAADRPGG